MAPSTAVVGRVQDGGNVSAHVLSPRLYGGGAFDAGSVALAAPDAALQNASLRADASGVTLRFTRRVAEGATALICAYGTSAVPTYHGRNRAPWTESFVRAGQPSAAAPASTQVSGASSDVSWLRTHGRLMLIAWVGCLAPGAGIGAFFASLARSDLAAALSRRRRLVFVLHVLVQLSGAAVATVSFALVVARRRHVKPPFSANISLAHGKVGVAAMTLLWAQYIGALLRPKPGTSRRRRAFELTHALLGRCALTLGVVNVFTGAWIAGRDMGIVPYDTWAGWAATAALGAAWLLSAAAQKALQGPQRPADTACALDERREKHDAQRDERA